MKPRRCYTTEQIEKEIRKIFSARSKKVRNDLLEIAATSRYLYTSHGGPEAARDFARGALEVVAKDTTLVKFNSYKGLGTKNPRVTIHLKDKHGGVYQLSLRGGIDTKGKAYLSPYIPQDMPTKQFVERHDAYTRWRLATIQREKDEAAFSRRVRMTA